jgi:hypothetical protein
MQTDTPTCWSDKFEAKLKAFEVRTQEALAEAEDRLQEEIKKRQAAVEESKRVTEDRLQSAMEKYQQRTANLYQIQKPLSKWQGFTVLVKSELLVR